MTMSRKILQLKNRGGGDKKPIPIFVEKRADDNKSDTKTEEISGTAVVSSTTAAQEYFERDFNKRMSQLQKELENKNDKIRKEKLEEYRSKACPTKKITGANWYRDPKYFYILACIVEALIVWVPCALLAGLILTGVRYISGIEEVWAVSTFLYGMVPGLILAVFIPAIGTFYKYDQLFFVIQADEVGVMEFRGTPIELDGLKPLGPHEYFCPQYFYGVPIFSMNVFKKKKKTIPITGSLDTTFNIPVQGMPTVNPKKPEEGKDSIGADKASSVEFGGVVNISQDLEDFRSLILLENVIGGIDNAGRRVSEALIKAMRELCCSYNGPQNQSEAIAMNGIASTILALSVQGEAWATGVVTESVSEKIQLPKTLRAEIEKANEEKIQRERAINDAQTAALDRYIRTTGNQNPTEQDIIEFARDPKNHLDPDLATLVQLINEGKDTSSLKIFRAGNNPIAGLVEQVLEQAKTSGAKETKGGKE